MAAERRMGVPRSGVLRIDLPPGTLGAQVDAAVETLARRGDGGAAEIDRLRGCLTLWANLAPRELLDMAPGPNGKTLEQLTGEALGLVEGDAA